MRKFITGGLLSALLSSTALADTSALGSGDGGIHGVLENSYIRAGVNSVAGSFGSGGNTTPGLLYDSTGTGTFNTSYDYLTPGSPFDGFSIKIDGVNSSNNNGRSVSWETVGSGLVDGENTLTWTGANAAFPDWAIENIYSLGTTSQYIDVTTNITAGSAADDVWFSRHIDPDARAAAGDSSATDNVLGYGVIPDANVAFSEALSSRYALGIYSTDTNVDAGISRWSQEADGYTENTVDGDGSLTNTGDNTIGLSWYWSGISAGDILTANYAYIFGPSAFAAAESAIDGGAGGGADTSSWGTLEDVGSATDAASGSGTPDPVITTETVVNPDLPVLTASITHHESSVEDHWQTISRERTTTTTTPMVTNTYTDGVLTSSVAAASEVETEVTYPDSFVGYVGQAWDQSEDFHNLQFKSAFIGTSNGATYIGLGKETETGVVLGFGFVTKDDDQKIGVSVEKDGMRLSVAKVDATHSYDRTIGDFASSGSTTETGYEIGIRYESKQDGFTPIVGFTYGMTEVAGWEETGSVQSNLEFQGWEDSYQNIAFGGSYYKDGKGISAEYDLSGLANVSLHSEGLQVGMSMDLDTEETFMTLGYNVKF